MRLIDNRVLVNKLIKEAVYQEKFELYLVKSRRKILSESHIYFKDICEYGVFGRIIEKENENDFIMTIEVANEDKTHPMYDSSIQPFKIKTYYTKNKLWVGDEDMVDLLVKLGIQPELKRKDSAVCSVGYSPLKKSWYGWSHRAIVGFPVGHRIRKNNVLCNKFPIGFETKNLDDCKKLAIAFADLVA